MSGTDGTAEREEAVSPPSPLPAGERTMTGPIAPLAGRRGLFASRAPPAGRGSPRMWGEGGRGEVGRRPGEGCNGLDTACRPEKKPLRRMRLPSWNHRRPVRL